MASCEPALVAVEVKTSPAGTGSALRNFDGLAQDQGLSLGLMLHLGDEAVVTGPRTAAIPAAWLFS